MKHIINRGEFTASRTWEQYNDGMVFFNRDGTYHIYKDMTAFSNGEELACFNNEEEAFRYLNNYKSTDTTTMMIVNPEYKQHLVEEDVPNEDVNYEEAKKELILTTRYYQWRNTIADALLSLCRDGIYGDAYHEELEQPLDEWHHDLIHTYNKYVDDYDLYGYMDSLNATMSRGQIQDILEKNNSMIN